MEEIIKEKKDMEEAFINEIDSIEQSLLSKYVESGRKFNKAYFANKVEVLKQQRRMEGSDISALIAKINENYMKNGSNLTGELNDEEEYFQSDYHEIKREEHSRSHTPINYRDRRDTHMKTTGPSHSSINHRYHKNKIQASNSRIPFPIFDQNLKTPNNEKYENQDFEEATPEHRMNGKVNEFSLCYSENISDSIEKEARKSSQRFFKPSERLRYVKESKVEIIEVNE